MITNKDIKEIFKNYEKESRNILDMRVPDLIENYISSKGSKRKMYEFVLANSQEYAQSIKDLINPVSFQRSYDNLQRRAGEIKLEDDYPKKSKLLESLVLACEGGEKFFLNHVNNKLDASQFAWEVSKVHGEIKNLYLQQYPNFDYEGRKIIQDLLIKKKEVTERPDENQLSLFEDNFYHNN